MKHDRDCFRNMKEVRLASYKARLVLRRKTATIEEIKEAALTLNKVVRTLQGWINNSNYYRRCKAEDQAFARDRAHAAGSGPLIPLTYK